MKILETERLTLREVTEDDADFMLDLLNQPSFIRYIGDRHVRSIDEAREFIRTRYQKSYRDHGYGLYLVELKEENAGRTPDASQSAIRNPQSQIGVCGFVKRDNFDFPDIGFAFLPQFEKKGYAFESASAVLEYGRRALGLREVLAITTQDNENSGKLLRKLGFEFDELIEMPNNEILKLYSWREG
jgi:RimJ/RimL family protein N-acetyltransferase